MKKLSEFYEPKPLSAINLDMAFSKVVAAGVKEIALTETELEYFLTIHGYRIPIDTDVGSGEFKFWGIKLKRI